MFSLFSPQRALVFLLTLGALAFPSVASARTDVDAINASLKRAEVILKLVNDAIGSRTSPPKGSAGKLNRMRLSQALPDLEAAGKLVAALKDGPSVAEAKSRYAAADGLYKKLNGILTGTPPQPAPNPSPKPSPAPAPGTNPPTPAAPKTVKLGYPHADNFRNALHPLRRVEGANNSLIKLMAEIQPVKDQLSIRYQVAAGAVESAKEALRQAGFAHTALEKVPSNGEGVAEAKQRLIQAKASIEQMTSYYEPLHAKLADLINPANYPSFQADLSRVRDLGQRFRNAESLFRERRKAAAEAMELSDASLIEARRIAEVYGRLIQQDTEMGRSIKATVTNFAKEREAFLLVAATTAKSLPSEIRNDSVEVRRVATEAVDKQAPLWFTGGIPQQIGWIDDKLELLMVLDPDGCAEIAAEVKALKADLAAQANSLKALIIRENKLPNDNYGGADRESIIALAKKTWKAEEADFELLAVRIPSDTWDRDTRWSYSASTWYFNDSSSIQVRLIVADKQNPEQAIDRPVNITKDHTKGDKLIGRPFKSFGEALQPNAYLLRSRIK